MKLDRSFYIRQDVVQIARELIGKVVFTKFNGKITAGIIIETEAYEGVTDRASHAFNGRRTTRTEVMYSTGGVAYVYLCYGMHSLFNIVTNKQDIPHAVLIRGIYPLEGLDMMKKRTGKLNLNRGSGSGPGKVSKILGIHYSHSGIDLSGDEIWLEDRGLVLNDDILTGTRIGVDYAGKDALLPYRFWIPEERIKL
ncbi:MAG: DNA-3-methyladenine glycosylase [Bacteroidales bacterium]|nr:DNA-3-methyladenine glycosylase [Bacteroidales bacterium]